MVVPWGAVSTASGLSSFHCCLRLSTSVSLSASIISSSCRYRYCCLQWLKMELLWWWWRLTTMVRWCVVATERKHGGSCGCSSSLLFFLFLPLSLYVLPRFFVVFPFSSPPPPKNIPLSVIFLSGCSLLSLLYSFPYFFSMVLLLSALFCFLFFSVFKCSPIFSLFKTFPLLEFSPFSVFIAKQRESPPCLVPSRHRRATRLPYPYRVRWPVVYRA